MRICGQEFSDEVVARIRRAVGEEPELSRAGLSRQVCQWLNWRAANGRLKEMSCRVALRRLEQRGELLLPAARSRPGQTVPGGRRKGRNRQVVESTAVRGGLAELGRVELVAVGSRVSQKARVWKELMRRHHYLGAGPLCGAQLRYLVRSPERGWLGGLAFSGAAWRLRARDQWIGWSERARQQHLERVVANSRFLILPQVEVAHLASKVLGMAMRRLALDWKQRYGYEPLLVETFVERGRFRGTSYRAANWVEVGQTQGRGRQDRAHRQEKPVKRVFVYSLQKRARQQLCQLPVGTPPAGPTRTPRAVPADWAEEEFSGAELGDRRLSERLLVLARDFYARPEASVPGACRSRAKTKAAYRFLEHPETDMPRLLAPHYRATQQRVSRHGVVLAVQDTSSLNYSAHPATEDLGPIASQAEGPVGLLLHSTLAFSLEGTPLGLLDVQCWARDPAQFGKRHQRKQRLIADKESVKWLKSFQAAAEAQRHCRATQLVSVGDREADLYELFHLALADPQGPKLLVRAQHPRVLAEEQGPLWEGVASQPLAGIQEIRLPRRAQRAARIARLEVRFAPVTLRPPRLKPRLGPLTLWAVLAQESAPPPGSEPVCWMLLTTCPVDHFQAACEKLRWYTLRWNIEVFHRTLKSGCRIEQRQLGSADRLEACLAIDLVVAWRIFHLAKLGRETPHVPCSVYFEEAEWKALVAYITQNPNPPDSPPSLYQAMRMVASLGGFLGRKGDGEPGTQTLWLGLQSLDTMAAMWKLLTGPPRAHPPPVSSSLTYG